jgi:indolepyruvate ferredoxin oxidoreductase alpha subunit
VLLRLTTRLAHSRSGIVTKEPIPQNEMRKPEDMFQFMLLPAIARKKYQHQLDLQKDFMRESLNSPFNAYKTEASSKKLGIITTGLAYNYLREAFKGEEIPYPVLKIGQYPLPEKQIHQLYDSCDELLVIEEGMPVVEEQLKGLAFPGLKPIHGRLDGYLPRTGELNPNLVAKAFSLPDTIGRPVPEIVVGRPPALCCRLSSFRYFSFFE